MKITNKKKNKKHKHTVKKIYKIKGGTYLFSTPSAIARYTSVIDNENILPDCTLPFQIIMTDDRIASFPRKVRSNVDCCITAFQLMGIFDDEQSNYMRLCVDNGFAQSELELICMYTYKQNFCMRRFDIFTEFLQYLDDNLTPGYCFLCSASRKQSRSITNDDCHTFIIGKNLDGIPILLDPQLPTPLSILLDPRSLNYIRPKEMGGRGGGYVEWYIMTTSERVLSDEELVYIDSKLNSFFPVPSIGIDLVEYDEKKIKGKPETQSLEFASNMFHNVVGVPLDLADLQRRANSSRVYKIITSIHAEYTLIPPTHDKFQKKKIDSVFVTFNIDNSNGFHIFFPDCTMIAQFPLSLAKVKSFTRVMKSTIDCQITVLELLGIFDQKHASYLRFACKVFNNTISSLLIMSIIKFNKNFSFLRFKDYRIFLNTITTNSSFNYYIIYWHLLVENYFIIVN